VSLQHFRIENIHSLRISTPNASKTPAPAFKRADELRLRLRGGRLLPHPQSHFKEKLL